MVLSLFAKLKNKYFQEFIRIWGREPQSAKEWMSIQDNAVRELNKTKGVPTEAKPPWHTGWTPKVVPGGKGIESLLKSGDVKKGVASKTTKETLKSKKDRGILLRDAEEDIARIKRENKQAVEDFKQKEYERRVKAEEDKVAADEDYIPDIIDPEEFAGGGRIGMAGGGALFKFIEQLFIKASNDIRLGRGKWKGLDQKQMAVQHDNLTKMVEKWQKTKTLPEGAEQYFGVDPYIAFGKAKGIKVVKNPKTEATEGITYTKTETTPNTQDPNLPPSITTTEGSGDMLFRDPLEVRTHTGPRSDIEEATSRTGKVFNPKTDLYEGIDERTMLKQKYPGLTDDLLEKILIDDNPQRKAEVLATMDEFLKLKEVGKSEEEAFKIVVDSFQKPTKHAEGGRIGFNPGGPVDQQALIQMYLEEGLSYEEAVAAAQATSGLDMDISKKADGGRAGYIFGGSAGLRALIKRLRGKEKRLFPSRLGTEHLLSKADLSEIKDLKLKQLENLLKGAQTDKKMIAQIAKNKKMADPGLDFLMSKMDETGLMPPNLSKYKNVDKDIMDIEMMIKNYSDKKLKRKTHQSGGLAYMLGDPTYMKYEGGGSVGHAPWHKPTAQQQPHQQPGPAPQQQQPGPAPQGGGQAPGGGRPNPMKAPRGLPSLAPRTMDPAFLQQQAMQRMMMGQGQQGQQQRPRMAEGGMTQEDFNRFLKEREEMHREGGKQGLQEDWKKYKRFKKYGPGSVQEAADGGRMPFGLGGIFGKPIEWDNLNEEQKKWLRENQQMHNVPIPSEEKAFGGRIGMAGGGAIKKFIEQLFIKASNDIRLGKGKWKGLDQKQKMVQHDNLTKKVAEFQKTGRTVGMEEYFGVDPHTAFIAEETKKIRQGIKSQKQEEIMEQAYEEIRGGSGFTGDDLKYDADILAESLAKVQGKDYAALGADEVSNLYDQAYKRISQDFLKRREAKKALKDVEQKIELQMFDPKDRKPNAEGGRIGMMYGGDPGFQFEYGGSWADWRDQHQHQMPVTDYIKTRLPKERLPFRDMQSGGIARLPFGAGGFSKARRAFLKMIAGLTGAGIAGGTGLLKLSSKVAPKVIKEAEVITRGADGIPKYVYDLIEVVKAKGTRDIIEGFKRSDYSTVHSYKGVDVTEDALGNIKIKSDKTGVATDSYTGKTHEGIAQENHIQIEKGQMNVKDEGLETQKSFQEPDEYIEGTVYPDMDGKMKDFEEGLDKEVHEYFQKIADEKHITKSGKKYYDWTGHEFSDLPKKTKKTKKASGGLAYALGE